MSATLPDFQQADLAGKRVLVRLDLNVPMKDGKVTDATRIDRSLPTVRALRAMGASVVIAAHLGRPKGQVVADLSLAPLVPELESRLGEPVALAEVADARAQAAGVVLLENLRFNAGEEKNSPEFSAALAATADVYIGDAFSCAHRAHASTEGVARLLPSFAGLLMREEVSALEAAVGKGERPIAAVVGGAKVSTKLAVLEHLIERVDYLIIGGGMANTFLAAKGVAIGTSLCEPDLLDTARSILAKAEASGRQIVLPLDVQITPAFDAPDQASVVDVSAVPSDQMILDVGPASVTALEALLEGCKTLLWNGPLGVFEVPPFDLGTNAVAQKAAALSKAGRMTSVAGGGDTVAALKHAGALEDFSYVSTAGGAFLEWLEGKELPGVAVLQR
jgi:phosphoglycerate kinase